MSISISGEFFKFTVAANFHLIIRYYTLEFLKSSLSLIFFLCNTHIKTEFRYISPFYTIKELLLGEKKKKEKLRSAKDKYVILLIFLNTFLLNLI